MEIHEWLFSHRREGGLVLVRELDERLGLGELIEQHLTDPAAYP